MAKNFAHHVMTASGVVKSVCLDCGNTIACGRESKNLEIAEGAHHCNRRLVDGRGERWKGEEMVKGRF